MSAIKAYEDRNGGFIFVKVPGEYGRYVRTNHSVALVACPACGSGVCVPCVGQYRRFTGSMHVDRAVAAHRMLREIDVNVNSASVNQDEHPIIRDDIIGDDKPGVIENEQDNGVVDLRSLWK